jgi:hypothetical protein
VLRRRRVEDDQVVASALRKLVDLLHCRVFGASGECIGHVLVDRIRENPFLRLGRVREAVDQSVECALHVEHQRVERARHRDSEVFECSFAEGLDGARALVGLGQAERVVEAPRRVDRQHQCASSAPRRLDRESCADRRLADAAGAGDHDDAPSFEESDEGFAHRGASASRGVARSASASAPAS